MSRVEDRAVRTPPLERGAKVEPLESDAETSYASLPLKPTRTVAVTVRRVGKLPPRPHRAEEPD